MSIVKKTFFFLLLGCTLVLVVINICYAQQNQKLLTLLDSKTTGITYQNNIKESGLYNHVFWENVYHGAGVAIGDINNDGLVDVFFAGNQVKDELYLNQGNFKFQNITDKLNTPSTHYWSNGVTMADVNADGWLDIYVSKSGASLNPVERKNLLYLNNKNETFTEAATSTGLADEGYSLQTVFFDMDNDGDLDAYVMNQPPSTVEEKRQNILYNTSCDDFSDNLYQNENGLFINITQKAGIQNCAYGLGVVATDINEDGWADIYVSNDYLVSDHLYINQKDGTFKDEAKQNFSHESLYAMGVDVADINNDALLDVFTADMSAADHYRNKANMPSMNRQRFDDIIGAGYNHQYMFNVLQLNNGAGSFSEIAQLAGVANTDWSWSVLLADLNNNQHKDIIITNGIKRDVRFVDGLNKLKTALADGKINLSEILSYTPSQPLKNFAYKNNQDLTFKDASEDWGFAIESFSNGMALGDLDNDGDLDVIVNNVDKAPFVFQNNSQNNYLRIKLNGTEKNPFAFGAKAIIETDGQIQKLELNPTRGYLSSSEPIVHVGLGENEMIEKLTIEWNKDKTTILKDVKANQLLKLQIGEAKKTSYQNKKESKLFTEGSNAGLPDFQHQETPFNPFEKEVLLPHKISQLGPALTVGDVDGNGLDDIFIGGAKGQASQLWYQQVSGEFILDDKSSWQMDAVYEDVEALFFDANNDGKTDIYVASCSNEFEPNASGLQDRLYINQNGTFELNKEAVPVMLVSTGTVKAADFDKDGDIDLFVGGLMEQQNYPIAASSFLLENNNGKFKDVTNDKANSLQNVGMIRDAVWADIDGDENKDLVVVGEWMKITYFQNTNGKLTQMNNESLAQTTGMWHSIEATDFDGDGDIDIFAGNLGLNNKFKKGAENGFHLFCDDFDENGVNDIVLSKEKDGQLLPVRGRECASEQMPFIAEKFSTYHSYAQASLEEIFTPEKLQNATHVEINLMESAYLENNGNGEFTIHPLPVEAQFSVIADFVIEDFDKDGQLDVVAVGNKYETEVETARYDAGIGLFIKARQKKHLTENQNEIFEAIPAPKSGLRISGNMRASNLINIKNKNILITAINNGKLNYQTINPIKSKEKNQ